jgi:dihydrofolate reductase
MRNLIFAINLTLDGCCDHTKLSGDEEVHEYFTNLMRDVDLLVYGRKTYQLMVPRMYCASLPETVNKQTKISEIN